MKDIKQITHRDVAGQWLTNYGMLGSAAEIGVQYGGFSDIVLNTWKGERWYMVDLWGKQDPKVYREDTSQIPLEQFYQNAVNIAARFPAAKIIRDWSTEAAKQVPDNSLDWVYIDANHAYGPVLADMDAWYPKLKSGGLFSGHDYGHDTNWPHWCEVKPAVDRWMAEHGNLPFVLTPCSSWWALKP